MSASPKIVQAALTVIATRGLDETSVRTVAAEAGVSIGAVQHHFRTKADLLVAAMTEVENQFQAELANRLAGVSEPTERMRIFLHLLAGVDDDTSASAIWTAFVARACVDPDIRNLHSRGWQQTESLLQTLLFDAGISDPADHAATLLALADGLAVARVAENERMSAERAGRLMDHALRLTLG